MGSQRQSVGQLLQQRPLSNDCPLLVRPHRMPSGPPLLTKRQETVTITIFVPVTVTVTLKDRLKVTPTMADGLALIGVVGAVRSR